MKGKRIWDSIPVRVGLAVSAAVILVVVVASLGSGSNPVVCVSELVGPSPETRGEGTLLPVAGDSEGRLPVTPTAPPADGAATTEDPDDPARPTTPATPGAPGAAPPAGAPAVDGPVMTVRIILWDDTDARALRDTAVSIGSASWTPERSSEASQTGRLTRVPVGQELILTVAPDGASGRSLEVPVLLNANMRGNSEEDAIHVAISDGQVRVVGTPVVDFDVSLDRR